MMLRLLTILTLMLLAALPVLARDCPPPLAPPDLQAPGRDRGLLWKLSRDGRDSYLYATLHVGRPDWLVPGPTLQQALRDTDLIALEVDITSPDTAREIAAAVAARSQQALAWPAAARERVLRLADRACLPTAMQDNLLRMLPAFQVMALTLAEGQWEGLGPMYAQELALALHARRNNRAVVALESVQQQLAALLPADDTEHLRQAEQALAQLEDDSLRPLLRRLTTAWERGDLAEIEAYPQWCRCLPDEAARRALARLNDDRNGPLAAAIEALHARDMKVFAAVGVLHMTGPQPLPQLLQQRGFRVERVPLPQ